MSSSSSSFSIINASDFGIRYHSEALDFADKLGFKTNPNNRLVTNIDEVISFCQEYEQKRNDLPYDIDGVVIKLNNIKEQLSLGFTARYPKWATAYKFKAELAYS